MGKVQLPHMLDEVDQLETKIQVHSISIIHLDLGGAHPQQEFGESACGTYQLPVGRKCGIDPAPLDHFTASDGDLRDTGHDAHIGAMFRDRWIRPFSGQGFPTSFQGFPHAS